MNTRRDNLVMILKAPLWIIAFVLFMVWMLLSMLILAPLFILVMFPCMILVLLSGFVGVISPSAGHAMTVPAEWVGELIVDRLMEFLWGKPMDLIDSIL